MFIKSVIIFAILVLFVDNLKSRSTAVHKTEKKIRCFRPDKPQDMPNDVYERYKISSKHLSEQDKKNFWSQFVGWWKNVFAAIGKFFEKVGKFFQNLFSKNKNHEESTTPMTEAPPTPSPQKISKDKTKLICVETEEDPNGSDNTVTTRVYEVDVGSDQTKNIDKLVTTIKTTEALITTVGTERITEISTTKEVAETTVEPETTPFEANNNQDTTIAPVIAGVENKAEIKKEDENTEATIVRAV